MTPWWKFSGETGAFEAEKPERYSRLYFPLCNEAGLLSAITPHLHGDIKTDQDHFLTLPVSTEDLRNTRCSRNFWIYVDGKEPWAVASGPSGELQAGFLWHAIRRVNRRLGLEAEILNFVPAASERVEIMQVRFTNKSRHPVTFTPTAAIPIFGRSADNLRDHRHVSSLLHRIDLHPHGVLVIPTMSFDERGHRLNATMYAVLGAEADGAEPAGSFPTVDSFVGEGGNFEQPSAVLDDLEVPELPEVELQGREAMGALRFKRRKLYPGKTATYILLLGIAEERREALQWLRSYGTAEKVEAALTQTERFWKDRLDQIRVRTDNQEFNHWFQWVALQPMLRKIFGCSFLPDFDYGRGGRGWRDLWQDCLGLILLGGEGAEKLLINNFGGVRLDGTNATIIGRGPGEFIADRNNLSRTWMDHGVWPFLTTERYIHRTGNLGVLLKEVPYFPDQEKTSSNGSVLEHLLVQHLTAYFNVGDHGNCRLLDADWNDGLDMAPERGESVAFTSVYAGNLVRMSEIVKRLAEFTGTHQVELAEDLDVLLESRAPSTDISPEAKRHRLLAYRRKIAEGVSGRKKTVRWASLAEDLRAKGESLAEHIRRQEWISNVSGHAWFNGYYDNQGRRVEGAHPKGVRMTLTGQVFPIMAGVASEEQVERAYLAAKRFLQDKKFGGFRLNTDFKEIQPDLGRAFSFAYGEKENGAFFSHMVVMFANALYQRGFVQEGHEVLSSLYKMGMNQDTAKIYPGIPEYFNGEGRGLYHYLTGSASWYLLTIVTEVLGIRGLWGDLLLAPKLVPEQFGKSGQISAEVPFAGKRLKVIYLNRNKKPYGKYKIESVLLHGHSISVPSETEAEFLIRRQALAEIPSNTLEITVALA